jgi:hypothetical protein
MPAVVFGQREAKTSRGGVTSSAVPRSGVFGTSERINAGQYAGTGVSEEHMKIEFRGIVHWVHFMSEEGREDGVTLKPTRSPRRACCSPPCRPS